MEGYRFRFRTILRIIAVMCVVTFGILLPLFCWNRPFSYFYLTSSRTIESAVAADVMEGRRADEYFNQLNSESSLAFYKGAVEQAKPKFAIGIITVKRSTSKHDNYHPRYLTRVVAEFDRLLKLYDRKDIIFFVCNAQNVPNEHQEAWNLRKFVPLVSKKRTDRNYVKFNPREQEKRDYVFCLHQIESYNAEYSIVVQDDALPFPQFITSLDRLLDIHVEGRLRHGLLDPNPDNWAAVKFYFPEKWQGYGYETFLIVELISGALFGGGILYGFCRLLCNSSLTWAQSFLIFAFLCVFFGLSIFIIGRPYLMTLRLLSVDFYSVRGAPECCIPAVLYKTKSLAHIRGYLEGITCSQLNPVDIAISRYLQTNGEKQYLIMPNLFNHIGMFSSLHTDINSPHLFWS